MIEQTDDFEKALMLKLHRTVFHKSTKAMYHVIRKSPNAYPEIKMSFFKYGHLEHNDRYHASK